MNTARVRVIPCLLLKNESLVKTINFKEYNYIGDPINTVRIFNELEVDELMFVDISASKEKRSPNFKLLENIANECFMPLAYGGGLKTFEDIQRVFNIGYEKIVLNSSSFENPSLIQKVTEVYGSQAVIGSIDYKKSIFGKNVIHSQGGSKKEGLSPLEWAIELEKRGVGELLLTSIDQDGTWNGYDFKLLGEITHSLSIPVIASGGAGNLDHLRIAVKDFGASAVAIGSMVVYQKKDMGVLVNFPDKSKLKELFN